MKLTKDEFAGVCWSDEDIEQALLDDGADITKENIKIVKENINEKHLTEAMITAGWDYLHNLLSELQIPNDDEEEI